MKRLRDRELLEGFEVLNYGMTRRKKIPDNLYSPTGFIIDKSRGYFIDQDGYPYVVDAAGCLVALDPEHFKVVARDVEN